MKNDHSFKSLGEFWPHYVAEHSHPVNRKLHFVGGAAALGVVVWAVVFGPAFGFLLAPVVGYAFAWSGHVLFEKNRPATFAHPWWSFVCEWKMWFLILRGLMDEEVQRFARSD